ncbi:hypothetical protein SMACR_00588 [Sordaria macrospora]|uniref:WGS project CABT00000000 data, contig 2.1 n=2 Tax=Sordaria macrospora TaxID=5147 RepID=F7VLJ6_SORMK|nr:uncharacterized protein SMAC_00588 [Sordaria macrospora k-hell]KAA8628038.1 hypothetical protein SMACR_00588 [Sordaria macrospora]KAH7627438.1 hypothetical protein B0T09DRAFT_311603 [Sordaria sp. MPI-SDFR-AT-0083]WPJ59339.1 hypothetical protein SMAC4_00588 [Sordaria macrospora]CCC06374.1 unnamed protein product [Sordaria macrospora k-hell]
MLDAVRKHRAALACASKQQEAILDMPLRDTHQDEVIVHHRVFFPQSADETNEPLLERSDIEFSGASNNFKPQTMPNKEETAHHKVLVRNLDNHALVSGRRDYAPIVNTSTAGQNEVVAVATMTQAFSSLNLTPNIEQPYTGSGYSHARNETITTAMPKQLWSTTHPPALAKPAAPTAQSLYAEFRAAELERRKKQLYNQKVALPCPKAPVRASATTASTSTSNKKEKSPKDVAAKKAAAYEELMRKSRAKRSAKAQKERETWTSHSLVDNKSRIDTKMNRLGKMGHRARHRCTWELKPFSLAKFVLEIDEPIPLVILTDPEGRRHFLEDPANYKDRVTLEKGGRKGS